MVRSNRRIVGIVELLGYNAVAWTPGYIGEILTTMAWRAGETSEARLQTGVEPGIEISCARGLRMRCGIVRSAVLMAEIDTSSASIVNDR